MANKVFIITGPSGVGKNHIINNVLSVIKNLTTIPTYTTRAPRKDDAINKNRICVTNAEYQKMIGGNELIEYKIYDSCYYGKRRADFEKAFKDNQNIILEIDTQGLHDYKKEFGDNLVSIFICYESLDALRNRIKRSRPDMTDQDIESRYLIAKAEMEQKNNYDYCIINYEGKPEIAIKNILDIINAST